ncbi:MAG: YggS family pyridoxal phosphate-dependent enzyme [Acidobacteria bacterium]|nr:MAG: YggS family pyridoxal phosphate-dependent enzyme [Acidobacteriota bacterium]
MNPTIGSRFAEVQARLHRAALQADRDSSGITLIAVSKTQPSSCLSEALDAGVLHLGENRVQEALAKKPKVQGDARWHLIGPLQRNKVKTALEVFDVIHTLDRPALADRLQMLLDEQWPGRRLPVLLEVNVGREPQKAGVLPEDVEGLARRVLDDCPNLQLDGLMAIPPFGRDPEASRPYFKALAELRQDLSQRLGTALPSLSMGMSHDFEIAIEEGATMVRVGTAIFGKRLER